MRDAFIGALTERARCDPSVMLIVGDLGFGVIEDFQRTLPEQFVNGGVSEQSIIGMSAGLAARGYRVFVYSIANFPTFRCLEQIRNDICYHDLPVSIVSIGAGVAYGSLGYTHHGIEDIAILRSLPNLSIYCPADPCETRAAMDLIWERPGPAYLRLGKNGETVLHASIPNLVKDPSLPLIDNGTANIVLVTGSIADQVCRAVMQSDKLSGFVSVFSVPVIKPLDFSSTVLAKATKIATVEEHRREGGFGSIVLERCSDLRLSTNILRIGIDSTNYKISGTPEWMRKRLGIDEESITLSLEGFFEA
jgi:transketolase